MLVLVEEKKERRRKTLACCFLLYSHVGLKFKVVYVQDQHRQGQDTESEQLTTRLSFVAFGTCQKIRSEREREREREEEEERNPFELVFLLCG